MGIRTGLHYQRTARAVAESDISDTRAIHDVSDAPAIHDVANAPAIHDVANAPAIHDVANSYCTGNSGDVTNTHPTGAGLPGTGCR